MRSDISANFQGGEGRFRNLNIGFKKGHTDEANITMSN